MMNLTINGQPRSLEDVKTVEDLLEKLGLDPRQVVVELNERVVRRGNLPETAVADNDRLEILRFVGGG